MSNFERDLDHEELMRRRLGEAVEKLADNSADKLGRLMGYTNGGFIREILKGTKPVGKAILVRIENVPGGKGWFDALASSGRLRVALEAAQARVAKELSTDGALSELSLRAISLARRFDGIQNEEHQRIAYALIDNALQQFEGLAPPPEPPAARGSKRPPRTGH